MRIPFNKPTISPQALENIRLATQENRHLSGNGPFTKRCTAFLEAQLGVSRALLTGSCTQALEMSALLLDIEPGDEVIVPAFTFVSTATAFVLRGAIPIFADIRPDTLNLDENILDSLITPRTKAIVVVHYAGVACEMDRILAIAHAHNIPVIEDNAHGLFGKYKDQYLGTFGVLSTQSFHETKNFHCGEGGALLINAPQLIDRAEILQEKGTNRQRFFRGQVDKYTWVDIGSSFLLSDILAAILYSQFEDYGAIQAKRQHFWETYNTQLVEWAAQNAVQTPTVPAHCEPAYHLFYLLMPTLEDRTRFIDYLNQREVNAVFHYQPLQRSSKGQHYQQSECCPVTDDVSDRLVRLPLYNGMTHDEQAQVIEAVMQFSM